MRRDPLWIKSRIAARLILRRRGLKIRVRDKILASFVLADQGVTNRLVDQAVASICVQKGIPYHDFCKSSLDA